MPLRTWSSRYAEQFLHVDGELTVGVFESAEEVGEFDILQDVGDLGGDRDVCVLEQFADGHIRKHGGDVCGEPVHGGPAEGGVVEDGTRLYLHHLADGEGVDGLIERADGHLPLEERDEDGGALFLDHGHLGFGEGGEPGAAGVRRIAADIAYDAVIARSVCAVNSFVIFLPLAGDIRPAAVRLVFEEDVVALALGVDRISLFILGVDERVVVEREGSAPIRSCSAILMFSFEQDVSAACPFRERTGREIEGVSAVAVRSRVVAIGILKIDGFAPMSRVVGIIRLIRAEGCAVAYDIKPAAVGQVFNIFVNRHRDRDDVARIRVFRAVISGLQCG